MAPNSFTDRPPDCTDSFIDDMPKVELHAHLGGSVEPRLAFDLLKSAGGGIRSDDMQFSTADDFAAFLRQPVKGLNQYLDRHHLMKHAFAKLDNVPSMVGSMVRHYAEQNTMHLEIRTSLKSADSIQLQECNYYPQDEIEAYVYAIENARKEYGMSITLILCMRRGKTKQEHVMASHSLEWANTYKAALDLAGKERGNHAKDFAYIYRIAKSQTVPTTCHCGEDVHEGSIRQAVLDCDSDRLSQITSIRRNGEVSQLILQQRKPLEMLLTPNIHLGALIHPDWSEKPVPIRSYEEHPFLFLHEDGHILTVNSDNPILMNTTLTRELRILRVVYGFSNAQILQIVRNAVDASFTSIQRKEEMHMQLDEYWTSHLAA